MECEVEGASAPLPEPHWGKPRTKQRHSKEEEKTQIGREGSSGKLGTDAACIYLQLACAHLRPASATAETRAREEEKM